MVARAVAQQALGGARPAQTGRPGDRAQSSRCAPTSSSRISGPARSRNGASATTRSPPSNPGLVMVRISGYGQTGPYRERPGFGVIGEAMGGLRHVTGTPDRPPSRIGISIGDTLSALYGVIGAMMALEHAAQDRPRAGRRRRAVRIGVLGDGIDAAGVRCVRRRARAHRLDPAGHRADLGVPLQRRQLRADRRQRRLDLQAAVPARWAATTSRTMPRSRTTTAAPRSRHGSTARSRRGRSTRSPDEVLAAMRGGRRAGVEDLHDRRHRRRSALRAREMIREIKLTDGGDAQGARHRAEAVGDARRFRRWRPRAGRAHRCRAARTGLRRRGHCRPAASRRDLTTARATGPTQPGTGVGRVEMWRGGSRFGLSVAAPFVWRCPSNLAVAPFPHPAHRTGHADLPHPALGQDFTPSPTSGYVPAKSAVRARSRS